MPYIEQPRRDLLDPTLKILDAKLATLGDVGGDLNYCLFWLMRQQYGRVRRYATIERLGGTLRCCWDEFYRCVAAPHEDKAADRNGGVA